MNRSELVGRVRDRSRPYDLLVVGGGATGVGIAVDAASRGYDVALFEGADFGKGTSSRSTKLVHGGVRYLQQGNVSLVMGALKERGILRKNAPHLVHDLRFIVPNYDWWEAPFYGIGLKVYDMLAGRYGFGKSKLLSREETLEAIPTLRTEGLRGGVQYYDGQFDDARLLINLVQTAVEQGAVLVNYCKVTQLRRDANGLVTELVAVDGESGEELVARGQAVINATGPFSDDVRRLDEPDAKPMIAPSQGVHLVLDRAFLPGDSAIMVPHTRDKRILFAVPWHDRALVGTTDTPIHETSLEPKPFDEEIDFILETAESYLDHPPTRGDVLSCFAGIRPLVKAGDDENTAALSRDHTVHVSNSGLISIAGGKWTTYRHMAEDTVDHAITIAQLDERPCATKHLSIHGYHPHAERFGARAFYGSDALAIEALVAADATLGEPLHANLPYTAAEVVWAARHELARTVDDVLARRTRALLLDAGAARDSAPAVAALLARELGRDDAWAAAQVRDFEALAARYLPARG